MAIFRLDKPVLFLDYAQVKIDWLPTLFVVYNAIVFHTKEENHLISIGRVFHNSTGQRFHKMEHDIGNFHYVNDINSSLCS